MKNTQKELSKEQKEILKELLSTEEKKILHSIKLLRTKGGVFIAKPLIEVYFMTELESVRNAVYTLICDLKESKTSVIFIKEIEFYSENKHLGKLLSAFWQSSIKFSELLPFINVFIKSDNAAAIEVLTIVEQNVCNVSDGDKKKCYDLIVSKMSAFEKFKKDIANEILVILK